MARKTIGFWEAVEAAARLIPDLWDDDDKLKVAELARYYEKKGHPVSQPTLSRLKKGLHEPHKDTIEATHYVFHVPRAILRGEQMSPEMDELLTHYRMTTILLAQKLERLPKEDFKAILNQIERAAENAELVRRAMQSDKVTPIDKNRR